jgi:CheY-like chemotaxis protein
MSSPVSRATFQLDFSLISFLIIDDQPFSRHLIRSMLGGFGSREVYESANGAEALELARTVMPNIIIIFNGLGLIKMVKEPQSPTHNIPIIVLSGYLTKAAALTMKNSGAEEILVKPVSPKALYEHIARIVLCNEHAGQPLAFLQNQKRRAEQKRKKAGDLAYI